MVTQVKKWGNSLAVRLPKSLAVNFGLKEGVKITFVPKGEGFEIVKVIKPVKLKKYTLLDMVKGITPKNRHKEFDWGKPRGKEIW
ncbi:hypothetical protein A3A09_01120 [Candidatus Nomurabacteria bacterium RIFCSPLOWO2_01_FULL_42_20]|uniref:SpoVT-AbrB domain-containing protein n=1 Tax=Candidatus Nomurabacteria bacterium RIFCSPHIGHO2_01_FULL_42_16 TaxID=1801743 RepID=A0A1F6VLU1_9BACT|nr:MAG: hypothetical protein A2824_00135 [Candidatus Nomurabacteria bacterium RIFCSPHIGHO2_01_FULL_42_16]OGI91780.1 MAG: hypothetical protein A3A09_01120 [Candidatus Nomurabacteria bacterium RIFCSPLOWO2_01_FULL_42_20]